MRKQLLSTVHNGRGHEPATVDRGRRVSRRMRQECHIRGVNGFGELSINLALRLVCAETKVKDTPRQLLSVVDCCTRVHASQQGECYLASNISDILFYFMMHVTLLSTRDLIV